MLARTAWTTTAADARTRTRSESHVARADRLDDDSARADASDDDSARADALGGLRRTRARARADAHPYACAGASGETRCQFGREQLQVVKVAQVQQLQERP
ncbi:hypothetical protein GCM10020218_080310 [Dactylosporangium vinaceum]